MENKWNVPAKGESWTADQLAEYLGLVENEDFEKGEGPPYLLDPKGALISGAREQIIQAMKTANQAKAQPKIVVPGMARPNGPLGVIK